MIKCPKVVVSLLNGGQGLLVLNPPLNYRRMWVRPCILMRLCRGGLNVVVICPTIMLLVLQEALSLLRQVMLQLPTLQLGVWFARRP